MKNETIENTIQSLLPGMTAATLSKPSAEAEFIKIRIRQIGKNRHFLIEQFTDTQSFHRTVTRTEAGALLAENIGKLYKNAVAETEDGKTHIIVHFLTNKKGKTTILRKEHDKPKKTASPDQDRKTLGADTCTVCTQSESSAETESAAASKNTHADENNENTASYNSYNRVKNYIIQEGKPVPFLVHQGIMTSEGKVTAKYYAKFRQINRFLEFIDDVFPHNADQSQTADTGRQRGQAARTVRVIDFGCGKSYLTFAIYYYLHDIRGFNTLITGIDLKKDVIAHCTSLAEELGCSGLYFICGNASDYTEENENPPDLVISLHACDTATDYALAYAVSSKAKAILSVPCCQHELNSAADRKTAGTYFAAMSKYGIIKERMCALTTDVMRAELLELSGYAVQILEFIDMEHTPKNLLIRAMRKKTAENHVQSRSEVQTNCSARAKTAAFDALCCEAGASITLEKLLKS